MLIKLKPKSIVTAYHCLACGAPCNPDDIYCSFCKKRYDMKMSDSAEVARSKVRLLVDCGNDLVYFPVKSFDTFYDRCGEIETSLLVDSNRRYIPGIVDPDPTLKITMNLSTNVLLKAQKAKHSGAVNMRFEIDGMQKGFKYSGYFGKWELANMGVNGVIDSELNIITTGLDGWVDLKETPDDLTCPNCGAPIKSRFGCCDYCTGWVEWKEAI